MHDTTFTAQLEAIAEDPGASYSESSTPLVRPEEWGASRFVARPYLQGGHRQTLYGWANPRYFPRLPAPTIRYFDVDRDARVLAHCHWQPRPWEHATILALHG